MKGILNALTDILDRGARRRTLEELLRRDDRMLADAGFSRELLLEGVSAWPWRHDAALAADARDAARMRDSQRRAVRELQSMNDRELADLDIARVDIPRAVREGRRGIEMPVDGGERIAA